MGAAARNSDESEVVDDDVTADKDKGSVTEDGDVDDEDNFGEDVGGNADVEDADATIRKTAGCTIVAAAEILTGCAANFENISSAYPTDDDSSLALNRCMSR